MFSVLHTSVWFTHFKLNTHKERCILRQRVSKPDFCARSHACSSSTVPWLQHETTFCAAFHPFPPLHSLLFHYGQSLPSVTAPQFYSATARQFYSMAAHWEVYFSKRCAIRCCTSNWIACLLSDITVSMVTYTPYLDTPTFIWDRWQNCCSGSLLNHLLNGLLQSYIYIIRDYEE